MNINELIGVTLGTCTIERVIGRGGMGAVFLAQQSRPMRTVAVKVLLPGSEYDPDQQKIFLARFRREADTVAKLEHKNILSVYEYEEAMVNGEPLAYIVMPYIRGGTLRERMDDMRRRGARFDLNAVTSYISQVADALSYAHSLGVVHRDIKPANLLFHQDGRLLLSDFGIVRLNAVPGLTSVGSFVGTAEYASPEQIGSNEVDARSDIYSLGIILYELLVGKVPFTDTNPFAVMAKQLNDPVPPVRTVRPDLSPAIEAVVMKALTKNPANRYQSATEMANALQSAISSLPASQGALRLSGDADNSDMTVPERPPSAWQRPAPPVSLVPVPSAVGAIPPTSPAGVASPAGNAPWQQSPRPWQWPSQAQAQAPSQAQDQVSSRSTTGDSTTPAPLYHEGRRLFYYGVALIALLLQFLVLILVNVSAPLRTGIESSAVLAILLGSSINLLALAAIGFTAVTRSRTKAMRRFFYRCLTIAILAPLVSGFFIDYGVTGHINGLHLPFVAYLILLVSNILAIRELGSVDVPKERIEDASVLWRPAIVGALTGLLPLTILLIFILGATPNPADLPLGHLFGVLFIALIGAPTPGAMMAVKLSQKMTFAVLLRTSAMAGMLMFFGAFLLVILWGLLPASHALFFHNFAQPLLALLIGAGLLGLIGILRGMLDAWVYKRIVRQ